MYRRPIFSLFNEKQNDQRIATSGDPINPVYDDGYVEEDPDNPDPTREGQVTYPSGTPTATDYGKLLASGEAGYFDIQSQSYDIERKNEDGDVIKPKGQGIDWVYPSPPDLKGDKEDRDIYWGLPSGSTKGFFQSGIYIPPNDEHPESFDGSGLDFYKRRDKSLVSTTLVTESETRDITNEKTRNNLYSLGIFNPNGMGSEFSSANKSEFTKFWIKKTDARYTPVCTEGVYVISSTSRVERASRGYDSNNNPVGETLYDKQSTYKEYKYNSARLIPEEEFYPSQSVTGYGSSIEEAIVDTFHTHLSDLYEGVIESKTSEYIESYDNMSTKEGEKLSYTIIQVESNSESMSGVIGEIQFNVLDDADGLYEVETTVDICFVHQTYQGFGTQEFIMNHKGTGAKDEQSDAIVGLAPIIIPYLGDYTVVKQEEQEEETDGETTYDVKGCDAVKSRLEKLLEGDEDLLKPEEETTSEETTDGTTGDGTTGDGTTGDGTTGDGTT